jgi:hypothetical protein
MVGFGVILFIIIVQNLGTVKQAQVCPPFSEPSEAATDFAKRLVVIGHDNELW